MKAEENRYLKAAVAALIVLACTMYASLGLAETEPSGQSAGLNSVYYGIRG